MKLLLHTTVMSILQRLELKQITISGGIQEYGSSYFPTQYIQDLLKTPHMWFWMIAQGALLFLRGLQVVGVIAGLREPSTRWPTMIMLALLIACLAPTAGLGNARYRLPMAPLLVLLTVMGASKVFPKISDLSTR